MARLEELERKFEENPRRYFAPLANEYRKAGDAQRAAELCRSQLPEVPGHISGHIVLGQALYDSRDFDGSRAALETALALDPENIVALRYLGDIARDTGDAVEAERWYSRTLEADPYNEAATTALEALRSAPPAARVVAEPREPSAPADSMAAGFEPTSHVEPEVTVTEAAETEASDPEATDAEATEPEPAESVEGPAVVEVAPAADIADAGFTETEQATEQAVEVLPEPEEHATAAVVEQREEVTDEAVAEPTEAWQQATEAPREPVEDAPNKAPDAAEPVSQATPEIEQAASGALTVTGEFAGDLSVSTAAESAEPAIEEPSAAPQTLETTEPEPDAPAATEPEMERVDVAAHAPPEPETPEEAIQTEERVLESAAPFVTETMADLYLEQGYPHEALELLLQLSEQRPHDEELRAKVEHIESVIVARRDAAVAAARAERAEAAEAAEAGEAVEGVEAGEAAAIPDAPFDAAVAEVDSSAFAASEPEPEPEQPISVRELFARMDRARPRPPSTVTPRPISRRRSDFVPMPEGEAAGSEASDDPFAFPSPPATQPVPRTSGPQQTFNPSTADSDDFNAWLRGLRGP